MARLRRVRYRAAVPAAVATRLLAAVYPQLYYNKQSSTVFQQQRHDYVMLDMILLYQQAGVPPVRYAIPAYEHSTR